MTQLVEELLELSRIESGAAPMHFVAARRLGAGDATRCGASRSRPSARASRSRRRCRSAPLPIIGDAERLERALGNLVANAIKFTRARRRGHDLGRGAETATSTISVDDTGIGIEPEQQARVFERFYKADRGRGDGGTGLGLAIVKHIVLAHEGTVAVESSPGKGSTFTMRVPRR